MSLGGNLDASKQELLRNINNYLNHDIGDSPYHNITIDVFNIALEHKEEMEINEYQICYLLDLLSLNAGHAVFKLICLSLKTDELYFFCEIFNEIVKKWDKREITGSDALQLYIAGLDKWQPLYFHDANMQSAGLTFKLFDEICLKASFIKFVKYLCIHKDNSQILINTIRDTISPTVNDKHSPSYLNYLDDKITSLETIKELDSNKDIHYVSLLKLILPKVKEVYINGKFDYNDSYHLVDSILGYEMSGYTHNNNWDYTTDNKELLSKHFNKAKKVFTVGDIVAGYVVDDYNGIIGQILAISDFYQRRKK